MSDDMSLDRNKQTQYPSDEQSSSSSSDEEHDDVNDDSESDATVDQSEDLDSSSETSEDDEILREVNRSSSSDDDDEAGDYENFANDFYEMRKDVYKVTDPDNKQYPFEGMAYKEVSSQNVLKYPGATQDKVCSDNDDDDSDDSGDDSESGDSHGISTAEKEGFADLCKGITLVNNREGGKSSNDKGNSAHSNDDPESEIKSHIKMIDATTNTDVIKGKLTISKVDIGEFVEIYQDSQDKLSPRTYDTANIESIQKLNSQSKDYTHDRKLVDFKPETVLQDETQQRELLVSGPSSLPPDKELNEAVPIATQQLPREYVETDLLTDVILVSRDSYIHNGKDTVTDLSSKHPSIHNSSVDTQTDMSSWHPSIHNSSVDTQTDMSSWHLSIHNSSVDTQTEGLSLPKATASLLKYEHKYSQTDPCNCDMSSQRPTRTISTQSDVPMTLFHDLLKEMDYKKEENEFDKEDPHASSTTASIENIHIEIRNGKRIQCERTEVKDRSRHVTAQSNWKKDMPREKIISDEKINAKIKVPKNNSINQALPTTCKTEKLTKNLRRARGLLSRESDSTDTESEEENEEKEDTDEDDDSSESEESKSSEEEDDEENDDDSSSDESEEGRKPSKVISEEKETQTEFKFDSFGNDSTKSRPEYKDISCGSEIVTNSQESQTDNAEIPKSDIASKSDPEKESEKVQVPIFPAPLVDLRDVESMTDVQLGPRESYVPFSKPDQKDSATWTDVSISNREVQTDEILFQSPKSTSEHSQVISSEIDRVPSSLNKEESPLLTNVSPIKNSGQDRGVQADIALKSRRVRTQTKVKRHDVQTLTSGLIKRVNMQTYTTGLVSRSDHSTNTVDMKNTVNIKMKNRMTQTEDYISGTINEKHGEENGTSKNTSQKSYRVPRQNLTDVSPESAASIRAFKGRDVERKKYESNKKELRQTCDEIKYKRSESISKQNSGDGEEEKKQRDKAFKQDSGSEEEEKQTDKPSEQDPGSKEKKKKKKTDKEKENFHRRRRRKRELYFLPIRHPTSGFRPNSSNQKRSRTRPKSSGSLPKRKSVEHGNARPVSCAQYRMLYHHRWAEIPF